MKRFLFFVLALYSLSGFGQIKLNQMEPFIKNGVRQDSGFILTNSVGVQTYVHFDSVFKNFMIDCDKVENCLDSGAFFCAKVLECLEDENVLCDALNALDTQSVQGSGNFIWINNAGECRRGPVSSLPGFGWNCDSVENCLQGSGFICEIVDSCLSDGGVLCSVIGGFQMGVIEDGDYVTVWNADGECKLVSIDSLGGGMDSLDCAAVLECLTGGTLCDALKELPEEEITSGFNVIGINGEDCVQIPWDSLIGDCIFEIEVGNFGEGPENCSFATSCDGGDTYSNQFWNTLELDGNTLKLNGNATGQSCLMSQIDLPCVVDSIWIDSMACPPVLYYSNTCGGTYSFAFPALSVSSSLGPVDGQIIVSVGYRAGNCGGSTTFCVCDLTNGCSGALTGVCGNETPLISGQQFEINLPKATNVYSAGIKEYRRNKDAKKDPELKPGDLYLLKGSNKLRFKR